jgi:phytoene dehydrogenase-like protein
VILAMGPREAERIAACPALHAWSTQATPVRAACLDLGLSALPVPSHTFAIGLDRPLYLSVHSAAARELAPAGGALVHAARYLHPDESEDRDRLQRELEALLDCVQPGWQRRVVSRKLLIGATVSHWLPEARTGGLAGRPGPEVAGMPGLLVAGDWVGSQGQLADAALASGRAAGRAAAAATGEVERAA